MNIDRHSITVHTPAGDVPGEIVAQSLFCLFVRYPGALHPRGVDAFDARTGVRRGEPSVRIVMETKETEQ